MPFRGIAVCQSAAAGADRIVFSEVLKDSSNADITSGSATVELYELQDDGSIKSFDFGDHTFKTTALTTATLALTHRTGNNGGTNTGIWSAALTSIAGFTLGKSYIAKVRHSSAVPPAVEWQFQYGGAEGDLQLTPGGRLHPNISW
jgi:hypothetical protein